MEPVTNDWAASADRAATTGARHAVRLLRLLHAVDCFPRGGLCSGYYALQAALRYEHCWLRLLHLAHSADLQQQQPPGGGGPSPVGAPAGPGAVPPGMTPPLDVAWCWWVHRQDPVAYAQQAALPRADARQGDAGEPLVPHPSSSQAYAFGPTKEAEWAAWAAVSSQGPVWPPAPPGSDYDLMQQLGTTPPAFAPQLAESMQRYGGLLHSWLRPHFLDADFLARAKTRYYRFLSLHAAHPRQLLVPTADIALLWHTHMGLSGHYQQDCQELFETNSRDHIDSGGRAAMAGGGGDDANGDGAGSTLWRPDYVGLDTAQLARAYGNTARLYQETYGEAYDCPDTSWVPLSAPYPLAHLRSPLHHVLRLYDDLPYKLEEAERKKAAAAARACGAVRLSFAPGAVPRSGAHALYAAWAAAWAVTQSVESQPVLSSCSCACLPVPVAGKRDPTTRLAWAAASRLVELAFFLDLPAWHTHPYLLAIKARRGLWQGASGMVEDGRGSGGRVSGSRRVTRSSSGGGTAFATTIEGASASGRVSRSSGAGGGAASNGGGGGGGGGGPLVFTGDGLPAVMLAAGGGGAGSALPYTVHDVDHYVNITEYNPEMLGLGRALVACGVPGRPGRPAYTAGRLGALLCKEPFAEALAKAFDQQWQGAVASGGRSVWERLEAQQGQRQRQAQLGGVGGGAGPGAGKAAAYGGGGAGAAARFAPLYRYMPSNVLATHNYIPTVNIQVEDEGSTEGSVGISA